MFKLGVDTWLWAAFFNERHLYCIKEAAKLGAEVIDFSINDPASFPTAEAAKLLRAYGLSAVTSTALPLHCNPISPQEEERKSALDFMKKLIDITAELGARVTGGVNHSASGYHSGCPRTSQEVEWCADYLQEVCAYAHKDGISVAMEPVKRFETHFLNTAEQAMELIEIVGADNLKVHLDTFHMNIEEADLPTAVRLCGSRLAHMHLVDSNRGAPGMGHIPWLDLFKALRDIDYQGVGCLETFNPETLDETCRMTFLTRRFGETPRDLAARGLRYLRAVGTMVYDA